MIFDDPRRAKSDSDSEQKEVDEEMQINILEVQKVYKER